MHGTEHREQKRRTLRLSAPQPLVLPATGSKLSDTPQPDSPVRDRTLVAAFRSPTTAASCEAPIPGSTFPTCCFASSPVEFPARSAFLLHSLSRFAPVQAASLLLARCSSFDWLHRLRFQLPLPFGTVASLRIEAFNWIRRRSARLPDSPDSLSLPAAHSIASFGYGSSFQVRYVSGGLLFLKPLGTFFTMLSNPFRVNAFVSSPAPFQQH